MTPRLANRLTLCLAALLLGAVLPVLAMAEAPDAKAEPLEIGAAGQAYLDTLWLRRIDSGVRYYDPARDAPDLEAGIEPVNLELDAEDIETGWNLLNLTFWTAGLGCLFLFLRFGGGLSVSFAGEAANPRASAGKTQAPGTAPTASLAAILAIADRRDALMTLAAAALARAVEARGLLFQRSWTGREALARLPEATPHRDALRALVLDAEAVHFGGRDIGEAAFRAHVAAVRPLLEATP